MTQMMMKASVAVVTLFLLFSSVAVLASELVDTAAFQPQVCCTRFNTDKIPENTVTGFKSSSKECDERGVIFERNSDPDICVDPSLEWVKKIIIGFHITMTNNRDICVDPSKEWVKKLVDVLQ